MPIAYSCMEVHHSQKDGVAHHAPTHRFLIAYTVMYAQVWRVSHFLRPCGLKLIHVLIFAIIH